MAEQDQSNVVSVPGFSESDSFSISQLKETLNDVLPGAFPDDDFSPIEVNSDPYDPSFLSAIQNYILNDTITSDNPDLQLLKDQYFSVSDEARTRMESYNAYFLNADASQENNAKQAQKIIHNFQKNSGAANTSAEPLYSPENDEHYAHSNDVTTYALVKYLDKMKTENPELVDEDFDASKLDGKYIEFMNRLVSKRMDEAGVKPDNLNSTLIHLWSMEEGLSEKESALAQAASARDLVEMMSDGKLPNGSETRLSVDNSIAGATYTGTMTEDRFFSKATYTAIMKGQEVSASTLFADNDGNPHVEDLKLAAKTLGIDTEIGIVSQEQVGKIAGLMLEYHACKLGIEKTDITAAINNKEFMPDLDDLRLVEVGLGFPPDLQSNLSGSDAFLAEFESMGRVDKFRNERWKEEFGGITEDEITRRINVFLNGEHVDNAERRQHISDNYTLPTKNYGSPRFIIGSTEPTHYEVHRTKYLEENIDKIMPCVSEVKKDDVAPETNPDAAVGSDKKNDFSAAASAPQTVKEEIDAGIKDATGSDAGKPPAEAPDLAQENTADMRLTAAQ